MRAVSPRVWNGWKATLLRELYARVAEVLAGGLATTERDVRVTRAKQAVARTLADWPAADRDAFLALGYPGYWLGFDTETHLRHARLVREADAAGAPLTVQGGPAAGPRGDRDHGLRGGPCRPVQPDRRRAGGGRRFHRGRAHPHADQRHGARHLLGAGRGRRRVRGAAPAGAALRAGGTGAVRPAAHGRRDPPGERGAARPPDAGDPRAAARGGGQPCQPHPHGDRGERPRPAGPAARRDGARSAGRGCRSPRPT